MDILSILNDSVILITPSSVKKKILKKIDKENILKDIKFLTFNDIKVGLLFDYSNQTISYLMHKYNYSYDLAKEIINDLYYLNQDKYDNDKLNNLLSIKQELLDNNLLITDKYFNKLISNKKIYVYGYSKLNKFNDYLINELKKITDVEILNDINDYHHEVLEFKNMNDEITYVAEEISALISNNVPLNKIYIANYNDEYYFTIKKIFSLYNIPIYLKSTTSLYDTEIGKYAINNLSNDLDKLLFKVKNHFKDNDTNNKVIGYLNNLLNTYSWTTDILNEKELLVNEAKHTIISNNHYNEEIITTNIVNNLFDDSEYVFFIGFNLNNAPKVVMDTDYISDKDKSLLMNDTVTTNTYNKEILMDALKSIKNLTITYKLSSLTTPEYYPSILIDDNYLVKKKGIINISKYSNKYNKLDYAIKVDNKIKYNIDNDNLGIYKNNYTIDYDTYSNKYEQIDKEKLLPKLQKKGFSYSNLSAYYKCPFRFYLSYFFNLDKYEQTLDTFIGSLFHKVLEDCITHPEIDIDTVYDNFIKDSDKKYNISDWRRRTFTNKDYFFVEKLRSEVHFLVEDIRKQYSLSSHDKNNEWHEKELKFNTDDIDINTSIKTFIHGYVDKVIFSNNNLMVIDYKTGTSDTIDPDLFKFGLNIQLPIYLYLLKNTNKDFNIVGLYLQHILKGFIYEDTKKEIEEIRLDNIKLDGITLESNNVSEFDSTYPNSEIIKGISRGKKRLKDQAYFDDLYNQIKDLLENVINNVSDANFEIKSIMINGKHSGCEYCKYNDICYKTGENINYITDEEIKEGGNIDE